MQESPVEQQALSKTRSALAFGAFAGAVTGAAALGAAASARPDRYYQRLRKPSFSPPPSVFGPVWSVLYGLMALSGWRVWRAPKGKDRSAALSLWASQLALNAAWAWIFFGRRKPKAALADLLALHSLITAYIRQAAKVDRPAAWLFAPYLGWVSFAGFLNEEIVRLNR